MSLLMDALRRAEAANAAPRADDAQPVAAAPVDLPASIGTLELEPLEGRLPELLAGTITANETNETASPPQPEPPAQREKQQHQAKTAVGTFGGRKSTLGKHTFFVLSGLVTAFTLLSGYYFWTGRDRTADAAPAPAARLIDAPLPASMTPTQEALTEPVPPVQTDTVKPVVTQQAPAPSETATSAVSDAPTTLNSAPGTPAPTTQPYHIEIHKTDRPVKIPPKLQQAYRAYRQQDYPTAEQLYREVLKSYPSNRDAMLGLAAIAVHQGDRQVAGSYYRRLLQSNPADKTALLGLQSLSPGQYSLEDGSKIKFWLQSDADNAQLHAALGNQYASTGQWKEAQQAYFDAHHSEPANADYAFNLAVSLDQLGLRKQALDYYRQARNLAENGGSLFSLPQLDRRIQQLASSVEPSR